MGNRVLMVIKKIWFLLAGLLIGALSAFMAFLIAGKKNKGDTGEVVAQRYEIEKEGSDTIRAMDDDEFLDLHNSVRDAGERGKERFRRRAERILHKTGGG